MLTKKDEKVSVYLKFQKKITLISKWSLFAHGGVQVQKKVQKNEEAILG